MITVIVVNVGKPPVVGEVPHNLENMQRLVGGMIERVELDNHTDLWCNEEGLIHGMEFNRAVWSDYGQEWPIMGPFFLAGFDSDGETVGLTEAQVAKWMQRVVP